MAPDRYGLSNLNVFGILWLLMFVLYFPAAKAGFVQDFTGWLEQVKNHPFWEYINRSNFGVHSLYQVTQFNTYIFYRLFGINPWLWHLLFITLHVINSFLLFTLCRQLLDDCAVEKSRTIAFTGVLLYCVSPYISEVVVWEPSFHFLQGLLMILLVLGWVQKYLYTANKKYALWAGIVYLLSTHTLEVFYITPWLVLTLALFYRFNNIDNKKRTTEILLLFFVPELLMFCLRLVEFRMVYGGWVSRIGSDTVAVAPLIGFSKPAKYIFHLLFLGRFFPHEIKQKVYLFCDEFKSIVVFYSIVAIVCIYIAARFRSMSGKGKVASLLLVWVFITFVLVLPLWFGDLLLVTADRYSYFTCAFLYMLLSVFAAFITMQYIRVGIVTAYVLVNLRYAIQVSRYWGKSYRVNYGLLHDLPDAGDKIIVLLALPQSMHGIPMMGAGTESEYKMMHNLLLPDKKINNKVYSALSYNMITPDDGAHVKVLSDNKVRVTLNQFGTWWWYNGQGAVNYETEDYWAYIMDVGYEYDITLKKPASNYLLLYNVGDKWKVVDMSKKDVAQY